MSGAARSHVTTHVLDATQGTPAKGIAVRLEVHETDGWRTLATETTDEDGRVSHFGPGQLSAGKYRVTFDTAAYFDGLGVDTFYPEVQISFRLTDPDQHYHVPLLLSPFSYSTYRGS